MDNKEISEATQAEIDMLIEEYQLLYVDNVFATEKQKQKLRDELIEKQALAVMERMAAWKKNGIL